MSTTTPRTVRIDPDLPIRSLSEVARALRISPQAVQQAEIRALKKLRPASTRAGMRIYLQS